MYYQTVIPPPAKRPWSNQGAELPGGTAHKARPTKQSVSDSNDPNTTGITPSGARTSDNTNSVVASTSSAAAKVAKPSDSVQQATQIDPHTLNAAELSSHIDFLGATHIQLHTDYASLSCMVSQEEASREEQRKKSLARRKDLEADIRMASRMTALLEKCLQDAEAALNTMALDGITPAQTPTSKAASSGEEEQAANEEGVTEGKVRTKRRKRADTGPGAVSEIPAIRLRIRPRK